MMLLDRALQLRSENSAQLAQAQIEKRVEFIESFKKRSYKLDALVHRLRKSQRQQPISGRK